MDTDLWWLLETEPPPAAETVDDEPPEDTPLSVPVPQTSKASIPHPGRGVPDFVGPPSRGGSGKPAVEPSEVRKEKHENWTPLYRAKNGLLCKVLLKFTLPRFIWLYA